MNNLEVLSGLNRSGFSNKIGFNPSQFNQERIDAIRSIIRAHLSPIKNISPYYAGRSYTLKHKIENYASKTNNPVLGNYVSNGECIYAFFLEGYNIKREGNGPNANFNISKKSFDAFVKLTDNLPSQNKVNTCSE